MAPSRRKLPSEIHEYLGQQLPAGQAECSPATITTALDAPFRLKYRLWLVDVVRQVVASGAAVANLVPTLGIDPAGQETFIDKWIVAGRPGL